MNEADHVRQFINIDGSDREGCGVVGLYNGKLLIKRDCLFFCLNF